MAHNNKKKEYSFLQRNGLTLIFFLLFVLSLAGQAITGYREHNEYLAQYGQPAVTLPHYLSSGHFFQATFENWESEFLQMALFVVLTISLRQKGSSESKPMEGDDVDKKPKATKNAPWRLKRVD